MLNWAIYAVSVSAILSLAGLAAESAARRKGWPTRWVWLCTIAVSLVIPAFMTTVPAHLRNLHYPTMTESSHAGRNGQIPTVVSPEIWVGKHALGHTGSQRWDSSFWRIWWCASAVMVGGIALSMVHLLWYRKEWHQIILHGTPVYLSSNTGPAVIGLFRPRIVIPTWLLQCKHERQTAVLEHEQSHIEARDPALLAIALCFLTGMPWNVPLWWQVRRLRCAMEVDCDARVLAKGQNLLVYGETLIAVSERQSRYIGSVAGMSKSRSFLEKRLRIMTCRPARNKLLTAVFFACMSTALVGFAAQVRPPSMNENSKTTSGETFDALDKFTGTYKWTEASVLSVQREGDHLSVKLSGQPWLPYLATGPHDFINDEVKATLSFSDTGTTGAGKVTLHQHGRDIQMPRITRADADRIEGKLQEKVKSQKATPGSEAALRRLIDGVMSGKPNYSEMAPGLQEATREQLPRLHAGLSKMGPVRAVKFVGVGNQGWDVYQVKYESGISTWRIRLSDSGIIDGALVTSGP